MEPHVWIRVCLLFAATCALPAQTLARPGWVGNGLNTDPWWHRAIFYRIAAPPAQPKSDAVQYISDRLDSLRSLGIDALIFPAPELPPPGSYAAMPNLDDFDKLLRQAAGHDLRVILAIQPPNAKADISGLARFWLNRGVAGLYLATPPGASPADTQAMVQMLRKLASSTLGQRIVISDLDLASPDTASGVQPALHSPRNALATRTSRISEASAAQLQIDSRPNRLPAFDAGSLRSLLAQTIVQTSAQPDLLLDIDSGVPQFSSPAGSTDGRSALAEVVAAIALLTHPTALIDADANLVLEPSPERSTTPTQPEPPAPPAPPAPPPGTYLPYVPYIPPVKPQAAVTPKPKPADPLTTWYARLAALHHDNTVFRSGSKTFLDFDSQNALVWVNRPALASTVTPPVVVICNLSSSPVQLSLTVAIKALNLRGWFLRTLLRSDAAMGAQNLDSVTVQPYSVYIGELRL